MEDKRYCMSSFLMFRTVADGTKSFDGKSAPNLWEDVRPRKGIHDSRELEDYLRRRVRETCGEKRAALALSGGMDSAILAKFMPEGSVCYTFRCIVPGMQVTDETGAAARYAESCGLEHRIVQIYWEDFEVYAPVLMAHKHAPIHSIEVQIYKAALQALRDGVETLIFGESADVVYGGMDGLLSKDWLAGDFMERYSYVMPYKALAEPELVLEPYQCFVRDGHIDPHAFVSEVFRKEGMGSYINATETAGCPAVCPFGETYLAEPIDYARIRAGENKYLVREIFSRLYPDMRLPAKLPMPRPMNEWMKDWKGPVRGEFLPHCTDTMNGDQKWLVWALERYLNLLEEGK